MFRIKHLSIQNERTELFNPLWATEYEGYEVFPSMPAALWNECGYFRFDKTWIPSVEPEFYSPDQIRQYLPFWQGAIAFLVKGANLIKLGYQIEGSLLEYLLDFALPGYLQESTNLLRWATVYNSCIPFPPGITKERADNFFICPLTEPKSVAKIAEDKLFSISSIPDGPARLIFAYTPFNRKDVS